MGFAIVRAVGDRCKAELLDHGRRARTRGTLEAEAIQSAASGSIQRARVSRSADNWSRRLFSTSGLGWMRGSWWAIRLRSL